MLSVYHAAVCLGSVVALADPPVPMSRIAPRNSFVVFEVADFSALRAAADGSALGELWRDERVQEFVDQVTREGLKQFSEQLATINARPEDITAPTGRIGGALFMPARAEGAPETFPEPHFLLVSDFGENAEGWRDLISRETDRLKGAGEAEITEEDHDGVPITIVRYLPDGGPDGGEEEEVVEAGGPQELFLAWAGANLCLTSHRAAAESTLDALGGREIDAIGENPTFERSLRQHGADPMAYGLFLVEPLIRDFRATVEENVGQSAAAMLAAAGLDEFRSFGMALRSVGGTESLAELTTSVLMPEKKGLVELFLEPLGTLEPPAFVGPDTATTTSFNFKFDGLIEALRAMIGTLPEEERAQASAFFEQGAAMMGPAFSALGPRVEYFVNYERPFTPESQRIVFAIQVRDELPVANTLTFVGQQMGLEARDFEGHTIYGAEHIPAALGLGGGYLFIGPPSSVENAMRSASNPEAPRLGTEAGFRRAIAPLSREAVLVSYSDLRQSIQWMYYMLQNFHEIQAGGMDLTPEEKEQLREQMPMDWVKHLPPIETLTSRLGFTVSDFRPTEEGFVGRSLLLKKE